MGWCLYDSNSTFIPLRRVPIGTCFSCFVIVSATGVFVYMRDGYVSAWLELQDHGSFTEGKGLPQSMLAVDFCGGRRWGWDRVEKVDVDC